MDISDKLIIVCIIFAILAILSIVFGCYYFSNKQENFKNKNSKESFIIKTITDYFKNNAEDFKIIEFQCVSECVSSHMFPRFWRQDKIL